MMIDQLGHPMAGWRCGSSSRAPYSRRCGYRVPSAHVSADAHDNVKPKASHTVTNPFEQGAPAQTPQGAPINPYAQSAPAPVQPGNPFGPGVAQQPQQVNPYAQPAPAAAPAQPYGPYGHPGAPTTQAPAPAPLNIAGLNAAPPAPPSGERGAKFADMYGRLVLFFPLSITRRARNTKYITDDQRARGDLEQDQLTATVVVLDDGNGGMTPISFGGDITAFPPVANTESAALPYVRHGMWITQSRVIAQLQPFLPAAGAAPGMVCGRMLKTSPDRTAPWYIQGATQEELRLAGQYLELVQSGRFPHPLAS